MNIFGQRRNIYKYSTPLNWITSGLGHFDPINRCLIKRSLLYYYYLVKFRDNRIVQYSVDQISVFGKETIHEY